jgi:hypothetical protein
VSGAHVRWTRIVWVAVPIVVALLGATVAIGWGRDAIGTHPPFLGTYLVTSVGTVSIVVAGAIIVSRRPRNAVGWLVVVTPIVHTLAEFVTEYAIRGLLIEPDAWPGAVIADWLAQWVRSPAFALGPLILLLFPDGRPLNRWWRFVARVAVGLGLAVLAIVPATTWSHRGRYVIEGHRADALGTIHTDVLVPAMSVTIVLAVASLVHRYLRGDQVTRLQVRWFALAGVIIGPSAVILALGLDERVGRTLEAVGMIVLAIALGVAMLRYRLYEIDRIISRTVTYGIVVAALGVVYVTVVVSTATVASALTGDARSNLAVAASVLVVAALFRPVRNRVRAVIDRRFNRTGYEARRAVDRFGQALRDEVDLEAIGAATARTAAAAVQPRHVSLWLAPDARGEPDES